MRSKKLSTTPKVSVPPNTVRRLVVRIRSSIGLGTIGLLAMAGCDSVEQVEKVAGMAAGLRIAINYCIDDKQCMDQATAASEICADDVYPEYLDKFKDYTATQQLEYSDTMMFTLRQMMGRCMVEATDKWQANTNT